MLLQPRYIANPLNRRADLRTQLHAVDHLLTLQSSLLVVTYQNLNLVSKQQNDACTSITINATSTLGQWTLQRAIMSPIFLGLNNCARAMFALALPDTSACDDFLHQLHQHQMPESQFVDLRSIFTTLKISQANYLCYARAMTYWHAQNPYCSLCSATNQPTNAGHILQCSNKNCAKQHFPNVHPAVIMLIRHHIDKVGPNRKCLLGRSAHFPANSFSTLAGFVEPGENLEMAVAREVAEEVGIRVHNICYLGSQPWPFSSSLMLGFICDALEEDISIDLDEIEDARWFTLEEVKTLKPWGTVEQKTSSNALQLPRKDSIAYNLIQHWVKNG